MPRYLSFGYAALVVGGLLVAVGAGLQATLGGPLSSVALTPAFAVAAALRLFGVIGMILGMTAVAAVASIRGGRWALVAAAIVTGNLVLQAGWMWADLFLSHAVAGAAPGLLDGTVDDPRLTVGFVTAWFMNVSFALLGVVVLRTHSHRRLAGWALLVMGLITLVPLPVDGPIFEVIIGLACAVVGLAARTSGPVESATTPDAVMGAVAA